MATIFAISTPIFEKPDEETHFAYVRHIALTGQLPTLILNDLDSDEAAWKQEGGQPPLYYWLAASIARNFDLSDFDRQIEPNANPINDPYAPNNKNKLIITPNKRFPNYSGVTLVALILRLLGILPACITLCCVYRIASRLNSYDLVANSAQNLPRFVTLAVALVAFNPMFLFISTSVSNDGLVIALSSIGLWLITRRLVDETVPTMNEVGLGVIIGLASITKLSGVLLLPIAVLAIGISAKGTQRVWRGVAIVLPWLAIAGWWYARNFVLYGDFTSTSVFAQVAGLRSLSIAEALGEWQGFRWSYIALFGQVNIPAPTLAYPLFDLWLVCCGAGSIIWLRGWRGLPRSHRRLLGLFAIHIGLVLMGILRWTMMTPASQGRLLFPTIAGVTVLLTLGWWQFTQLHRWLKRWLFLPVIAQIGLSGWMGLWQIPSAYTPTLLAADTMPAATSCTMLSLDPLLDIFCPTFNRITPDRLQVIVPMQAKASTGTNYLLTALLINKDGEVGKITTYTGGGLWPSTQWQARDGWREVIEFRVPPTLTLPVKVTFSLNDAERNGLPIFHDPNQPANQAPIGKLEVGNLLQIQHTPLFRGQPMQITLTWQAAPNPPNPSQDYNVFLQLVDASGKIITQRDGPPANGFLPTSRWRAPLIFDEQRSLNIPANLAVGPHRLLVGMYNLQTGARIGIQNATGEWQPDAALSLKIEN